MQAYVVLGQPYWSILMMMERFIMVNELGTNLSIANTQSALHRKLERTEPNWNKQITNQMDCVSVSPSTWKDSTFELIQFKFIAEFQWWPNRKSGPMMNRRVDRRVIDERTVTFQSENILQSKGLGTWIVHWLTDQSILDRPMAVLISEQLGNNTGLQWQSQTG